MSQKQDSVRKIPLAKKKFPYNTSFHDRKKFLFEFPSEKHMLVIEEGKSFCHRLCFATEKSFCHIKRLLSQNQGNMKLLYQGLMFSSPKGKCVNSKPFFLNIKIFHPFCRDFIQYKFMRFHGTFQIKIKEITEENHFVEFWGGG